MFGDDSLESIEDLFNQLAGRSRSYRRPQDQSQEILNTIESDDATTLIFDLSGKKVISVKMQKYIGTNEYGEKVIGEQKTLVIEIEGNEIIKYNIPSALARRKMDYTFSNGILEVSFRK